MAGGLCLSVFLLGIIITIPLSRISGRGNHGDIHPSQSQSNIQDNADHYRNVLMVGFVVKIEFSFEHFNFPTARY